MQIACEKGLTRPAGNAPFHAALQQVGVDHGGAHVLVTQQFLPSAEGVAGFEEVRGKTLSKRVQISGAPISAGGRF